MFHHFLRSDMGFGNINSFLWLFSAVSSEKSWHYLMIHWTDPCDVPLGMEDGRVTKGMLTASSMYNHYYGPWSARLQARNHGSVRGGWIAKYRNSHQWLQIDLGIATRVKRIATQGRYDANQWVKSYTVSYSNNGVRFFPVKHGRRVKVTIQILERYLLIFLGAMF